MLRRPHRFDVVVIPANAVGQTLQNRVGFDDRWGMLVAGSRAVHVYIADFDAGQFLPLSSPKFHRCRCSAWSSPIGRDMNRGMIGIHPQADRRGIAPFAEHRLQRSFAQPQGLAEGLDRQRRIAADPHPPHLQKSRVVAPGVGLRDIENQVTVRLDPGIQSDVAVPERHRAVRVGT